MPAMDMARGRWRLGRIDPRSLGVRFALLLIAVLLGANLIAALIMAREGSAFDRAMRLQGDVHRLSALVAALETADAETARLLTSKSSTGFTRFSIGPAPLSLPDTTRLFQHEVMVAKELPGHDLIIRDAGPPDPEHPEPLLLVSVRLERGNHAGEWLNALAYPLPAQQAWAWKMGFFAPLLASLLGTLTVGLVFVRRMTRPLQDLARAARLAGRGDRDIRLPETGASELRAAAAAFNDMQHRAANFEAERMRLLAALGHDLRTPITGLRIRAEMIEDDQRDAIIRVLDDMAVMCEGLLHASLSATGAEARQPTDLSAMIARLAAERGIAFPPTPPLVLDLRPVAMTRALTNLIDNALRYGCDVQLRLSCDAGKAIVLIEDRGPGICENLLPRITEPCVRGETSRSHDTGGAGLGLYIAVEIARAHGGTLWLENRKSGGLRAALSLPIPAAR